MKYTLIELDNYILDYLQESDPEKKGLIGKKIAQECTSLKIAIYNQVVNSDNEVALHAFYNLHMQRLVELADLVFDDVMSFEDVNIALLALIDVTKKALPAFINRNIALPKAFRVSKYLILKETLDDLIAEHGYKLTEEITSVLLMPLADFGDFSRKLSWFHFIWLKRYIHTLSSTLLIAEDCRAAVMELLVSMDFNGKAFITFCIQVYLEKIGDCEDRPSLDFVLHLERKALAQLPELSKESFYMDRQPIREGLDVWLDQEIRFQTEYDMNVFQENGKPMRFNMLKLRYNLTVDQLAFWQKLQYDEGLLDEPDLNVLSEKMAYNFSSASQQDISASSIKSKFYPKDSRVISPLHEKAKSMVDNLKRLLEVLEKIISEMEPFLR